jgi:hypothetical protein
MPNVWQKPLTGGWRLLAYCASHCSDRASAHHVAELMRLPISTQALAVVVAEKLWSAKKASLQRSRLKFANR